MKTRGCIQEWRSLKVGDVLLGTQYGLNLPSSSEGNMPIVGMKDLNGGLVRDTDLARVRLSERDAQPFLLHEGDLLLNRTNSPDLVGKIGYVDKPIRAVFASYLVRLAPDPTIINARFLAYWLVSSPGQQEVRPLITRGVSQANINPSIFCRRVHAPVPPLDEQRRIAEILSTWDGAIEHLARQMERKNGALAYLRENLVHGARRLNRRNEPWPVTTLGAVTEHLTARNGGRFGRDSVMGVTKADGLVSMKEHVIADDIARYLVVPPDAFAYNPMRINIGSIVMSERGHDVIVSPDYVVFACKAKRLLPRFLNHLRRTKAWSDFMTIAGNGSVRVRIYYASLSDFEFHLPPLDEQAAIVEVLDDGEREIEALGSERAALERQRDALADELLTGRLRVPESAPRAVAG